MCTSTRTELLITIPTQPFDGSFLCKEHESHLIHVYVSMPKIFSVVFHNLGRQRRFSVQTNINIYTTTKRERKKKRRKEREEIFTKCTLEAILPPHKWKMNSHYMGSGALKRPS